MGADPALAVLVGRPVVALKAWLHSGYLTKAANRGIPLPEAMQQSQHKSLTRAASYYNDNERKMGRAANNAACSTVVRMAFRFRRGS